MYNDSMDLDALQKSLAQKLGLVEAALSAFVEALAHSSACIVMDEALNGHDGMRRAGEAFATINYAMDDVANESVICPGVIGVSTEILKIARRLNSAKDGLKSFCAPLQGVRVKVPVRAQSGRSKLLPLTRVLLRRIQRSDLNLLAAYRHVPILDAMPTTITYTQALTRAVYRKPVNDIITMLLTRDHPAASRDRANVHSLDPHETHLALVGTRYANIRANVRYLRLDPRGRGRAQFAAEMPLLFLLRKGQPMPIVNFPISSDKQKALRSRLSILRAEPFLESLPVYRYAPE